MTFKVHFSNEPAGWAFWCLCRKMSAWTVMTYLTTADESQVTCKNCKKRLAVAARLAEASQ
jgi:hypothetical protein